MIRKTVSLFIVTCSIAMGTNTYADYMPDKIKTYNIATKKLLRFTDTKEEYGKACEEYRYISPLQRLQLIRHGEFMLGDILSDTLAIPSVDRELLVETNLSECRLEEIDTSVYIYRESLEYLGENMATIKVFQYEYGAGAAHGNGHTSYYVYDREYGMRLDWKDLFGFNKAFELYILKSVVREITDEDFISRFKASDQLLNFRQPGYFAITDEGLVIQYGKYEIAPGSSGLPSLFVPKEVLKQYIDNAIYQKYFTNKEQMLSEAMYNF